MPVLDTATLGPYDTAVTRFAFGAGFLGDPDAVTTDETALATMQAAWDAGVRYFDTAPWYGHTKSEHRVGQFLRHQRRSEFVLSTKVGRLYGRPQDPAAFRETEHGARWVGGYPFVPRFDYSRNGICRSYEDSLQRLALNRVDFLVIHDLDPRHQKGEDGVSRGLEQLDAGGGYAELRALRDRGEIKAIGAGVNHTGMIPRFVERFDLDYFLVAMPYTLADQSALDGEFQLCAEHGVKVVIGAVFASGILATGVTDTAQYGYQSAGDDIVRKVSAIEAVCERHDVALPAAALQFPLAHPVVASIIPGANDPQQVQANARFVSTPLPAAFWEELRHEGLIRGDAPLP